MTSWRRPTASCPLYDQIGWLFRLKMSAVTTGIFPVADSVGLTEGMGSA